MTSQLKPQDINFNELMDNYKKNTIKRMKVVNHDFLYTCFHPRSDDIVICLEKNSYPNDVEIYNLKTAA